MTKTPDVSQRVTRLSGKRPPKLRKLPPPRNRVAGYIDTPRPLLAHADPDQLHAAAIERLVRAILRPVLWPLTLLSGIVSRTIDGRKGGLHGND